MSNEDDSINIENNNVPSMKEFEHEINRSFKKINEGDIMKGTVIGVSDTEVVVDLDYYSEGIIKLDELSNDPRFSIKSDISVGDQVSAMVLREDKEGNIILSRKKADDVLAWEHLKGLMDKRAISTIKVAQTVKKGVTTYLDGIHAFIPASQLSLEYVEDLEQYVGRELEVIVVTVDEEKGKLVLSAKEVLREKEREDKEGHKAKLQEGLVTTGTVEKIMPFGAFVDIGKGLSGLVHISQICDKRIKTPSEVVKVGDEVRVKIMGIKDGKISLSMKAVEERDDVVEDAADTPVSYSSGEEATTGLGDLLKGIKLE